MRLAACLGDSFSWAAPQWESPVSSQNRKSHFGAELERDFHCCCCCCCVNCSTGVGGELCLDWYSTFYFIFVHDICICRLPPPASSSSSSSSSSACFQSSLTCWRRQQLTPDLSCLAGGIESNQVDKVTIKKNTSRKVELRWLWDFERDKKNKQKTNSWWARRNLKWKKKTWREDFVPVWLQTGVVSMLWRLELRQVSSSRTGARPSR